MPISPNLIKKLISEFLERSDPTLSWTKPAVRKHEFLPLYVGWVATIGLRADGSFVRWNHDRGEDAIEVCTNYFLQRMALQQGSDLHPELKHAIPPPPPDAAVCSSCGGQGRLKGPMAHMICECGGLGWVIPGEDLGTATG